ncbi:hypothetical protein BN2537_3459 [Streptomyces venezuelae]|nr:hypothetical protein BN2537_3459 [Streptomyces venezuelae]
MGREELLARLERVLHARGRALLTGPAGVGKTELALAEAARAEARGETVLWLATLPSDREIPGAAAAALVASVAATVTWPGLGSPVPEPTHPSHPSDPSDRTDPSDPFTADPHRTRASSTTGLSAGPGPSPSGQFAPGVLASGVFDELPGPQRTAVAMLCREAPIDAGGWDPIALRLGIARILRALAGRGPVLLVVDGVQYIDADSADLLRFALHLAPPALRVVAVETPEPYGGDHEPYGESHRAAFRPEDPHATHLWVPSEADVLLVPRCTPTRSPNSSSTTVCPPGWPAASTGPAAAIRGSRSPWAARSPTPAPRSTTRRRSPSPGAPATWPASSWAPRPFPYARRCCSRRWRCAPRRPWCAGPADPPGRRTWRRRSGPDWCRWPRTAR